MATLKRKTLIEEMEQSWKVKVPPELHSMGIGRLQILQRYIQEVVNKSADAVWNEVMKQRSG